MDVALLIASILDRKFDNFAASNSVERIDLPSAFNSIFLKAELPFKPDFTRLLRSVRATSSLGFLDSQLV